MLLAFATSSMLTHAANQTKTEIEWMDDGDYIETTIASQPSLDTGAATKSGKTITGHKTSTYRDKSGKAIWSVTVTGTFHYDGSTAKCTGSSISTSCSNNAWKITDKKATKSGNKAIASTTVKKYVSGSCVKTIDRSVTLTCSKSGTLS